MRKIAVISQSARLYAHFVHLAGHQALSVDAFADVDTLQLCADYFQCDALMNGWNQEAFVTLIKRLDQWQADTLIIGSGFEHTPERYAMLYERYPLAGNAPALVSNVKDPFYVAEVCQRLGVLFPEVRKVAPAEAGEKHLQRWLMKQLGGCGGGHICFWQDDTLVDAQHYLQRWQPGLAIGGLCVGNGEAYQLIGVHQLYQAQNSFCYAGVSRLQDEKLLIAMQQLVARLYTAFPLKGIFSVDALWHQEALQLLEINPRLSASMRLYDSLPLIEWHLSGCEGWPLSQIVLPAYCASHRILYAKQPIDAAMLSLPEWVEDRTSEGVIAAGQPVCSLYAQGNTEHDVQQELLHQQTLLKKQWGPYVSKRIQFIH